MSEIMFSSVKDAVRWSQEVLSIPDIGSQLGKLMIKPGGDYTKAEVRDIGHTISLITAACKPFGGEAMFAVYAGHDTARDHYLGDGIGLTLHATAPGCDHDSAQLQKLGLATVKAHRAYELYNDKYPIKRMAYDVGVTYHQFRSRGDWPMLRAEALGILCNWMAQAEREIYQALNELQWISCTPYSTQDTDYLHSPVSTHKKPAPVMPKQETLVRPVFSSTVKLKKD